MKELAVDESFIAIFQSIFYGDLSPNASSTEERSEVIVRDQKIVYTYIYITSKGFNSTFHSFQNINNTYFTNEHSCLSRRETIDVRER